MRVQRERNNASGWARSRTCWLSFYSEDTGKQRRSDQPQIFYARKQSESLSCHYNTVVIYIRLRSHYCIYETDFLLVLSLVVAVFFSLLSSLESSLVTIYICLSFFRSCALFEHSCHSKSFIYFAIQRETKKKKTFWNERYKTFTLPEEFGRSVVRSIKLGKRCALADDQSDENDSNQDEPESRQWLRRRRWRRRQHPARKCRLFSARHFLNNEIAINRQRNKNEKSKTYIKRRWQMCGMWEIFSAIEP